jgi:hypothetical protein
LTNTLRAFVLVGLAGLCFLQFLGSLRGALARAEGELDHDGCDCLGVAFIAVAISAHTVGTAVSWSVWFYGAAFTVDPDTARVLASLSYGLYVMSLFAAGGMALATATVGLWMRAFPSRLAWLSVLATIGIFGFTGLVVLAWIVLLSVYLVWPRPALPGREA